MRLLWLLVILATGTGLWFYIHPDSAGAAKALLPDAVSTPRTDRLYKWRNERGEWQVTDAPPRADVDYETLDFRADVNVLPVPPQLGADR